jgi:hypothetical protein
MESHGASDGRESADALQRDTQARWVCEGAAGRVSNIWRQHDGHGS